MNPMATPNAQRLLGVITDDDVAALDARNKQRAAAAIQRMGVRHCLHGANSPKRAAPVRLRRATDWPPITGTMLQSYGRMTDRGYQHLGGVDWSRDVPEQIRRWTLGSR